VQVREAQRRDACSAVEEHIEYTGRDLHILPNVSMEVCCLKCRDHPLCAGWNWDGRIMETTSQHACRLKAQGQKLGRLASNASTSGRPFRPGSSELDRTSLLCFTLILPHGIELELLSWQHEQNASIFGCEEWEVYSNESVELVPSINTTKVEGMLMHCQPSMPNHTASGPYHCLNAQIFMEVWKKVITQGRFVHYSWTVKVDADTVFLPARLRPLLRHTEEPSSGLLMVSGCKSTEDRWPIEVLSRSAVQAYSIGWVRCVEGGESTNQIVPEAQFMERCLSGILHVHHEHLHASKPSCFASNLLNCSTGRSAAFNHFRSPSEYQKCVLEAQQGTLEIPV